MKYMNEKKEYQKKILELLKRKQRDNKNAPLNEIPVLRTNMREYDVSHQQERIIRAVKKDHPISVAYNIPFAYKISGKLDIPALRSTIEAVSYANEALRTVFVINEDHIIQVLTDKLPEFETEVIDADEDNRQELIADKVNRFAVIPFDTDGDSFCRWKLFIIGEDEYILSFTVSHIIADGWSSSVIFEELSDFYNKISNGEKTERKDKFQFSDYIEWYKRWNNSPQYEKQLDYWMKKLENWKQPFVFKHICDEAQLNDGDCFFFAIDKEILIRARKFASVHSCSLFILLFSVFNSLLYSYSGADDIVIAIPNANRSWEHAENVVGFFANDQIIDTYMGDAPDLYTLIERVRSEVMLAVANSAIIFDDYFCSLLPDRDKHDMIRVKFNYMVRKIGLKLNGTDIVEYKLNGKAATSNFNFVITEENDKLCCCIEYNKGYFTRDFISIFSEEYIKLLSDTIDRC